MSCWANFAMSARIILAEPLYIALQMAGYLGDAHALVNKTLVPLAKEKDISLMQAADQFAEVDQDLSNALANIPPDVCGLLVCPDKYVGDAEAKTMEIVALARAYVVA